MYFNIHIDRLIFMFCFDHLSKIHLTSINTVKIINILQFINAKTIKDFQRAFSISNDQFTQNRSQPILFTRKIMA